MANSTTSLPARGGRRVRLAVTGTMLVLLVACGGDDDDSNTAAPDPTTDASPTTVSGASGSEDCLVTLDEVAAALPSGTNPEEVDLGFELDDATMCGFSWTKFKQGTLQVTSYDGTAASVEEANPRRDDAVDVPGLGDRAYATGGERSLELTVFKGSSAVVIAITQFPPAQNIAPRIEEWKGDALTAAKQLAVVALGRL
jgi:hypothetical protein